MIINITVEPLDEPRVIETTVAPELRARMSFETTPEISKWTNNKILGRRKKHEG